MGKFIDLTGQKFNRLTVIERDTTQKRVYWKCQCDCGNITSVEASKLKSGHTKSCGCLNKERQEEYIKSLTTHHKTHTKLHYVWCAMRKRCYNTNDKSYKYYGGSGIKVCDEWLGKNGFQSFYDWAMENGYKDGLTIDRIDNEKNYSPDNCRWVSMKIQSVNKKNSILVTYKGRTQSLVEWCRELNLNYYTIKVRMDRNKLPFEYAISMPSYIRVMRNGKLCDLRKICRSENIDYRKALYDVVVNGKTYEEISKQDKEKSYAQDANESVR